MSGAMIGFLIGFGMGMIAGGMIGVAIVSVIAGGRDRWRDELAEQEEYLAGLRRQNEDREDGHGK